MTTREKIGEFLGSPDWNDSEKWVIEWQFGLLGDFETALKEAIIRADEDNLQRLYKGFPMQVHGFTLWAYGSLAARLREAGLGI